MAKLRHTKEIFDILKKGSFISQNSTNATMARYYSEIEDDIKDYAAYYEGVGYTLEGENGYFYFSKQESRLELSEKVQRLAQWIDRIDFLKTYNNAFSVGFSFQKSDILVRLSSDIELKEKTRGLYTDVKTNEEKIDKLVQELLRIGFIEVENEEEGSYKVVAAFRYIENLLDSLTIFETEEES